MSSGIRSNQGKAEAEGRYVQVNLDSKKMIMARILLGSSMPVFKSLNFPILFLETECLCRRLTVPGSQTRLKTRMYELTWIVK